ncbi:MAG: hypothetical protein IPG86_20845 [Chitinophagaceae bacterium]|nr:hypothetical protein [Chitinophagaceae bacterium]
MQRFILMLPRFISLAICFLISFLPIGLQAQDVIKVQNGASITVQNGADIVVLGGIALDNGSSLVNNGSITLKQNGVSGPLTGPITASAVIIMEPVKLYLMVMADTASSVLTVLKELKWMPAVI